MKPLLVTSYVGPDLDGTACALAYAELLCYGGKEAQAGFFGAAHEETKFVLAFLGLEYPEIASAENFEEIILVDASDMNGMHGMINPAAVVEVIDHRKINNAELFSNARIQIELVGAAATLIAEKFIEQNITLSQPAAVLLASAIISNTLNFQGTVTTERDRKAYFIINKVAKLSRNFWEELFLAKSDLAGDKLLRRIRSDRASFTFGGKKIGIAQIEIIGVESLLEKRLSEIAAELDAWKREESFDFVFQNTVELKDGKNFFVACDGESRALLEAVLNIRFQGDVAERDGLILRKQITPFLKEEMEKISK